MCECAETYGHSATRTRHATPQAASAAIATSRCENTERAIMCNMLSNSIAPSLSLPFVTPNRSPPPPSPRVPISVASARVLPATPPLYLSVVRILLPSASHAFMKKGAHFQPSQQPEPESFSSLETLVAALCGRRAKRQKVKAKASLMTRLCDSGQVLENFLSVHLAMQKITLYFSLR